MKNLIALVFLSVCLFSCKEESSWENRYSANGKDSVVHVRYVDDNGNRNDFFMNYLLFHTLFNIGGYSGVNNYYSSHRPEFGSPSYYTSYSARSSSTSSTYRSSSSSYSSPSSPSRSSYRPSSYSSPSRSFSSPSRSFGSSSRSFSSPSRR